MRSLAIIATLVICLGANQAVAEEQIRDTAAFSVQGGYLSCGQSLGIQAGGEFALYRWLRIGLSGALVDGSFNTSWGFMATGTIQLLPFTFFTHEDGRPVVELGLGVRGGMRTDVHLFEFVSEAGPDGVVEYQYGRELYRGAEYHLVPELAWRFNVPEQFFLSASTGFGWFWLPGVARGHGGSHGLSFSTQIGYQF